MPHTHPVPKRKSQPMQEKKSMAKCAARTEVYSRVCGYFRPVANWNKGKKEEFKDRRCYKPDADQKEAVA